MNEKRGFVVARIVVLAVLMLFISASLAYATATVSHPASQVTAGVFDAGEFTFNGSVSIQDSAGANVLYVNAVSGYIGIGTANPAAALDVNGTISGSGAGLTDLNASRLEIGIVPSLRVSGSYAGITGVGTLAAGTWNANTIGVVYGGTGGTTATDARYYLDVPSRGGSGASGTWGISISGNAGAATYGRYVYDNGDYGGSLQYKEPSGVYTAYAASAGSATSIATGTYNWHTDGTRTVNVDYATSAGNANACTSDGNCDMPGSGIWNSVGNVGIGTTTPQNKLDVEGGAVIGATYSGTNVAPTNGLLVQGSVGIGLTNPGGDALNVQGRISMTYGTGSVAIFETVTLGGAGSTCTAACLDRSNGGLCLAAWTSGGVASTCATNLVTGRCLCAGFGS